MISYMIKTDIDFENVLLTCNSLYIPCHS